MFNWFTQKESKKEKSLIEIGKERYEKSKNKLEKSNAKRLEFCNNLLKDLECFNLDAKLSYSYFKEPYVLIKFKNKHLHVYYNYYTSVFYSPNFDNSYPLYYNRDSLAEAIYSNIQNESIPT